MADRLEDLERRRIAKVEALRASGIDPYPVRFDRTHTAAEIHAAHDGIEPGAETGERVAVAGRLMLNRPQGKIAFAELRDASGKIQLFVQQARVGDEPYELFQ